MPGGNEFLHRMKHVFDVDDQYRQSVLPQRARSDVLDLAEARVERLYDELTFAEKAVDDQSIGAAGIAHDEHRQVLADNIGFAAAQYLLRADEANGPSIEDEMLPAFQDFDFLARQLQRAHDVSQREGIGLAADLHEQRTYDRQRQRQLQLEARALARLG